MHNIDPYGSGFDLFVGKTFPYGLARLFLSLHVIALLRCWDSITRAGLYIKPASDVRFIEVDRPETQSLRISPYITAWLYPQSDPM